MELMNQDFTCLAEVNVLSLPGYKGFLENCDFFFSKKVWFSCSCTSDVGKGISTILTRSGSNLTGSALV
jgi:hypothetical protein